MEKEPVAGGTALRGLLVPLDEFSHTWVTPPGSDYHLGFQRRLSPRFSKNGQPEPSMIGHPRHTFGLLSRAPKFFIVGLAATFVHFSTLTILVEITRIPGPTFASAIGSIAGIATSYYGNYVWTFVRTEPHRVFVTHFVAAYVFTMGIHTLVMYYQINLLKLNYVVAFLLATSLSTLMNFLLSKFAVFERKGLRANATGETGWQ
jgi:putative flippase GtrA